MESFSYKRVFEKGGTHQRKHVMHQPKTKQCREEQQKMTTLVRPGLMFQAFALPCPRVALEPTMSTYGFGDSLESTPKKGDVYVICKDGSIQCHHDPERSIGWELIELDDGWMYRITQMNHKPKPLSVSFYGWATDIPEGNGSIGSVVVACRRDEPQSAEVTEQKDQGEEVNSTPPCTPCPSPECPDAPRKNFKN